MKKLTILPGSDSARLILGVAKTDNDARSSTDDRFELPVTDRLRSLITQGADEALTDSHEPAATNDNAASTAATPADVSPASDHSDHSNATDNATSDSSSDASSDSSSTSNGPSANPKPVERPKLTMSPKEIQQRIRQGASIAALAEESGMATSRIEPFAHPILAERARVAKLGKTAHPVRQDGPSTLTLWEVLATSFAARGADLSAATWNAFRDENNLWIIAINWASGHSTVHAEWSYHAEGEAATVVARNEMAAELIDPDFGRTRNTRQSTVERTPFNTAPRGSEGSGNEGGTGGQQQNAPSDGGDVIGIAEHRRRTSPSPMLSDDEHPLPHPSLRRSRKNRGRQDLRRGSTDLRQPAFGDEKDQANSTTPEVSGPHHSTGQHPNTSNANSHQDQSQPATPDSEWSKNAAQASSASENNNVEDSFLEYPEAEVTPTKRRRRKAVTPHWEDVLLGVRPKKDKEKDKGSDKN